MNHSRRDFIKTSALAVGAARPATDAGATVETAADEAPTQSRGGPMGLLGLALALTGLAVVAFAGAHAWASNQWQVAERDGRVASMRHTPRNRRSGGTGSRLKAARIRFSASKPTRRRILADRTVYNSLSQGGSRNAKPPNSRDLWDLVGSPRSKQGRIIAFLI